MGNDRSEAARDHDSVGTTVSDAARILGITEGAVRKRVERGKLAADRAPDGRLVVYLNRDTTATDTTRDRTRQSRATGETEAAAREDLVEELRDRVRYLERQIEEEREARRRADTLLAQLMQRIPELEAPQEPAEGAETVEQEPEGAEHRSDAPGAQEGARRPWWRRVFGG
jgi:seryl-tRNA synthetase